MLLMLHRYCSTCIYSRFAVCCAATKNLQYCLANWIIFNKFWYIIVNPSTFLLTWISFANYSNMFLLFITQKKIYISSCNAIEKATRHTTIYKSGFTPNKIIIIHHTKRSFRLLQFSNNRIVHSKEISVIVLFIQLF